MLASLLLIQNLLIVSKYAVIQYGVCYFTYNSESKKYIYKPFNFYVFPHSLISYGHDRSFNCQASSLSFLAEQGFDFNKLVNEGISYLNVEEEERIKTKIVEKQEERLRQNAMSSKSTEKEPMQIPEDQQSFIDDILKKVEEFVKTENMTLKLSPCSSFQRKLLYETLKNKYPSGLEMETQVMENNDRYIVLTKATKEDIQKKLHLKFESELSELGDAVGFSKIIKLISKSRKLVVGHNIMLDLMYTINSYIYPLPQEYNDFKEMLKCTFPQILDTKVLANSEHLKDSINNSTLSNLLNILLKDPFKLPEIEAAAGFEKYNLSDQLLHEAGYDAFITGVCLIGMCQHLSSLSSDKSIFPGFSSVTPYINKGFLMMSQDIPYFNLDGEDLMPDRYNVFHVSFPREWNHCDLRELFFPFGHIQISWIDDTSAFVALKDPDQASKVMKRLTKGKNIIYKVRSFADYKRGSNISLTKSDSSLPCSDVNLPVKRKKSSRNAEITSSVRTIDPIPEEDEEAKSSDSEPQSKIPKRDESTVEMELTQNKEQNTKKLFEEEDNW
ncbi:poly(A)-specific ribonuclease PARN-like isoform X2 [Centruroides sculpturatus]|uniref:poly(A)-specific ribonuclease PARN-like isoform X2 n=1 Tax=Centruroides sculpturatus TaxID=218467 RepID=UPI000C6CF9E9|nr:poly(A)-specific ribonuclease PARN-like isoform X2 [Centruroides sculpturatus]